MSGDDDIDYAEKKRKHRESKKRDEDNDEDKERSRRRRRHKKERSEHRNKDDANENADDVNNRKQSDLNEENEDTDKTSKGNYDYENLDKNRQSNNLNNNNNTNNKEKSPHRKAQRDESSDDENVKILKPSKNLERNVNQKNKQRTEINLWDLAVEQMELKDKNKSPTKSIQSIIFLGGKGSGKTTLLLKCLGRSEDNIKATIGIDYTFIRKNKIEQSEEGGELGDVWELGGGVMLGKLINNLINEQSIRNTSIVMVIDLSDPVTTWVTIETWLEMLKARVSDVIRKSEDGNRLKRELEEKASSMFKKDHTDLDLLDLQLLPILIVANKYDVLQNMEGEDRRVICKALRFISHRIGAHLQFCSTSKMESLVGKVKCFVNHRLFETPLSIPMQTAHNKPLTTIAGQDSFLDIGMPIIPDGDTGRLNAKNPFELWKYAFNKRFPQQNITKHSDGEDPTLDPQFREPEIDAMKIHKDQEFLNYMKSQEGKKRYNFN